ncbi:MAG: terminase family protein [Patescibacteria group bacterium]|nr:terminase family protein [Patescibacteria group bacterium]
MTRRDWTQSLVLCGRQTGKSTVAASLAYHTAVTVPGSTTLIISRSLRQAGELKRKVDEFHYAVRSGHAPTKRTRARPQKPIPWAVNRRLHEELDDEEAVRNSVLSMELANGSRVLAMPCTADTAVGFTIDLLIYDEAARIPDGVYSVMRPTLARARSKGRGRLLALSTPNGKRGWFWEAWKRCLDAVQANKKPEWHTVRVPAGEMLPDGTIRLGGCPHLSLDFLQSEVEELGKRWFRQEYGVEFVDAIDAVFSQADIERALRRTDVELVQEDL